VKRSARWPFLAWALLFALAAQAEVPNAISYQGLLLDAGGQPSNAAANLRFRILRGGDDMTFPSAGSLVYHERATVHPVDGVFSHLIGTGTPAADCDAPCVLSSETFASGNVPTWIEVTVDPDGIVGNSDDDVLLPRTRVGTVGYAYRVASLDRATGGDIAGTVVADTLVARDGAIVGDPEAAGGAASLTWDPAAAQLELDRRLEVMGAIHASDDFVLDNAQELRFGSKRALTTDATGSSLILGSDFPDLQLPSNVRFDQGITLGIGAGLTFGLGGAVNWGPFSNPVPGTFIRQVKILGVFADGNLDGMQDLDHVWGLCYNCRINSAVPDVAGEYQMMSQWEMTYAPSNGTRWIEHNWDFRDPAGTQFRPLAFVLDTDRAGAYANPTAGWTFNTSKSRVGLHINANGNVRIGSNTPQPTFPLEVSGTVRADGDLRIGDASGVYVGTKKALNNGATGELVLGQDHDVVRVGTASLAVSVCPAVTAAPQIAVAECNLVQLGGTASVHTIDTCDANHAGRVLYVLCEASAQLCDSCGSGNLRLSGNLDCTADDTLTLVCDGSVWKELDRSVN
jgi:hypothetical protein